MKDHEIDGVHTIPVPYGWSIEQAWESIVRGDILPITYPMGYFNVLVTNGRFEKVVW